MARGLYHVPRRHPIVGLTALGVSMIVKALARKTGARFQEAGACAANLLELSDQVPAKVVFLTDGRSKRIRIGKMGITLKRTTPRNMATAGRTSGLVIQALRYIGKTRVTDDTVRRLARVLPPRDRRRLLKDAVHAPAWVADVMQRVAANG